MVIRSKPKLLSVCLSRAATREKNPQTFKHKLKDSHRGQRSKVGGSTVSVFTSGNKKERSQFKNMTSRVDLRSVSIQTSSSVQQEENSVLYINIKPEKSSENRKY
ncbi:hypothetical protein EXN66_Car010937 [Channa argus]|uniref:Uncharacterized protein n=1 Tax=Channa argus TaxID=215402 RepID=A0A6G1PY46_CHAAH|nr:hypothetical protein EXN66_Car010937 [Channa argus]